MDMTPIRAWLHQGTTILGIAACGTALSAYLLDQATPRQAIAMAIGGIISIAMKQTTGTTVVTGAMPVVNTTETTIAPAAGSTTTIRAVAALLCLGLALSACTTAQEAQTLAAARQACAAHAVIVAVEPGLVAAHPGVAAQADAACAVVAAVKP